MLSIDVDMPLSIRLPKVRRKESKRHSSAAASAGGGGDGDAASLASAMSASTNSVKSLGLAREFFKFIAKEHILKFSIICSITIINYHNFC